MPGDIYKRRLTKRGVYQCGCYWIRRITAGDVLVECAIHRAATRAAVSAWYATAVVRAVGSGRAFRFWGVKWWVAPLQAEVPQGRLRCFNANREWCFPKAMTVYAWWA
jgi:hypothetical protein